MIDLDELRRLSNAATPGPWSVDGPPDNQIVWSSPNDRVAFLAHSNGRDPARDTATGEFIATANPSTILALLDEIDRCHARLEIDHVWHATSGGDIPVRVTYSDRVGMPDGIECRDETIKI